MINLITPSRYKIGKKKMRALIEDVIRLKKLPVEFAVNIVFTGKNKMRSIAAKYKNEDEALPVLSFSYQENGPGAGAEKLNGEIFICYPQAVLLAAQRNKKVDQMILELVKHGVENIIK